MDLPDTYKTGNKKFDEAVRIAFKQNPHKPTQLQRIIEENSTFGQLQNKYHVSEKEDRTYHDGTLFASKAEMERWHYLLLLQRAGKIKDLQKQVPFILQEEFLHKQYGMIRPILYVADFVYTNITYRKALGEQGVIEDSKTGVRTGEYKMKRKMLLEKYPDYLFYEV